MLLGGAKLLFPVKLRLSKLGGGGKYPLLFNGFVKLFTIFVVCWEGVDKGWLLKLSIYFFDNIYEPKSSSKNKFKNFCALNYFDPKYGGNLAFLKMAWDNDNSDIDTLSAYFYSSLISKFFKLILSAYLKISIFDLGYVIIYYFLFSSSAICLDSEIF